ncbi:cct motif family protein [Stylonychia lemnae]|uniref:Cct motif family protein n=1 Tax=Stylonychia lemnae TaxID=5949 RepID=A0A077ZP58_STYLE|nr:cct motif family protein [Stylonychia lemnae]|eukprot:CDW71244.1 cct motif family protein [Stylonychia lemnae]
MLTPLKRSHQPTIQQSMMHTNLTCYQNLLKDKEHEYSTANAANNDIFQSEIDEPSTTMPFKSIHSFGWQDSFIYGRLSMNHRNSFEDIMEKTEKNLKVESLESCVNSFKPFRSSYFECLNNLHQEEGYCTLSNTNYKEDNFMEDVHPSNNSASLGGIDDIQQENMTDLYWQGAAAQSLCQPTDSIGPDYFQDEQTNQTINYQDNCSDTNTNITGNQIRIIRAKERKQRPALLKLKRQSSNSSNSVYKKNKVLENLDESKLADSEEKRPSLFKQQSNNLIKRKSQAVEETAENTPRASSEKAWIGPLSISERMEKVRRYLHKKGMKSQMKKFCYKCRKQVAEKRLRIKGRFVTKEQAFEILGITSDELKSNEIIQKLLENHAANMGSAFPMVQLNSLVESQDGNKSIKIRNFQALIDDNYNHNSNHNGSLFFTKYNSSSSTCGLSTSSSSASPLSNLNEQNVSGSNGQNNNQAEEYGKQVSLNLRISTFNHDTTKMGGFGIGSNNHVSKVMIQNYQSFTGEGSISQQVEETLKLSLSNLRLEGYVQPLFRVEKMIRPTQI